MGRAVNPPPARDDAAIRAALTQARELVRRGDHRVADAIYQDLVGRYPGRADVLLDAGRAARRRDDAPELVTSLLERAVAAAPTWPEALLWLAQMCAEGYGRGYPAAAGLYRRVIELDPGNVDAHIGWGMLRGAPGVTRDVRLAIDEFARAVQIAPGRPDARRNLGMALLELGDARAARDNLAHALELYRQRGMSRQVTAVRRVIESIDRGAPKATAYVDESPRWQWPDDVR
jgi:tetratricopeptide (TPR) repeat protein